MACLRAAAACTAGTPTDTTLAEAAGVDVRTVRGYLDLLEDLRVIERLQPWYSNRLTRLVKAPKLHVVDPAIAATVLGVDARGVVLDGHLLGQLLEYFVLNRRLAANGTAPTTRGNEPAQPRGGCGSPRPYRPAATRFGRPGGASTAKIPQLLIHTCR